MPIKSISDLTPDPNNANKGTPRGLTALEESIRKYGAGRSIVVDKNGVIIGGNKTLETAYQLGLDIKPIHTSGNELVVVVRDDLDLQNDPRAKALAIADNRAAELSLDWDASVLSGVLEEISGTDLEIKALFADSELEELLNDVPEVPEFDGEDPEEIDMQGRQMDGDRYPVTAVLSWSEMQEWKAFKEAMKFKNDKQAILGLMRNG